MKHENFILGIGIALVLIPILGFPPVWNRFMIVVLGLCLCLIILNLKYGANLAARLDKYRNNLVVPDSRPLQTPASPEISKGNLPENGHDQNSTV